MAKYGTPPLGSHHPLWCDPTVCEASDVDPHAEHLSASQVVTADPPCTAAIEMHLVSSPRGLSPRTMLLMEFDAGDDGCTCPNPQVYRLTAAQTSQLHDALGKLLAATATP